MLTFIFLHISSNLTLLSIFFPVPTREKESKRNNADMLNILHCYVTLCMHYFPFFCHRYQWSIVLCQHSRIISVKFIVKLFIACLLMKGVIETFSHTCTMWSLELTNYHAKKLYFLQATTMAQKKLLHVNFNVATN